MLRISAKKQYGRVTTSGQKQYAHETLLAGKTTAIRREASPIAEDKQYGRKASPRPGGCRLRLPIIRETGQHRFTALRETDRTH